MPTDNQPLTNKQRQAKYRKRIKDQTEFYRTYILLMNDFSDKSMEDLRQALEENNELLRLLMECKE